MIQTLTAGFLLLAPWFPAWASAENPLVSAEEAKAASHNTPLVRAMLARDQAEAIRLIQSGTPLDLSIDENALDDLLTKRARMLSYGNNTPPGYPLAIAAALLGLPGVLEAIGEREPARLHVADSDNKTAINYAAHQGYAHCVAALLRHSLNPLQPPHDAWASGTPLSRAVMKGSAPTVKLLLDAIPKAQYTSERVTEQVWYATSMPPQGPKHMTVLQTLLDAGISPNFIAPQGGSALIDAIENQNPAQVRLLIEHGAKAYSHAYRGRTAHEWAAYYAGPDASPAALEIAGLVGTLKVEPSVWQKSMEIEKFENTLRLIGEPGKP
jgi:ankyrin repeat protein